MGFYEQEGVELNFVKAVPNIDGLSLVADGRYEVGQLSSSPSLMVAVSQNVPIKCFAVGAQQHPFAFFSRKHSAGADPPGTSSASASACLPPA